MSTPVDGAAVPMPVEGGPAILQPPVDPAVIRSTTREVLSRPEFQLDQKSPDGWEELARELMRYVPTFPPELGWPAFIVLLIVVVAMLVYLLLQLPGATPSLAARRRLSSRPLVEILEGTAENWRDALELALRAARDSDHRRAVWIGHRVMLALLDAQGAIRFSGWKTNSSYLRECAKSHPSYPLLSELTDLYEQVVYGRREMQGDRIEAVLAQVRQIAEGR